MNDTALAQKAWSHYWHSGFEHSCFAAAGPVDTGGLWADFIASLAPGAAVLDAACGAGALTRRLLEAGAGLRVTGVDYAEALPVIEGATLLPATALEALPFAEAEFDAVVSQFGLEYAELEPALSELVRVLKPDSRIGLLMHHAGGAVAAQARAEAESLTDLLTGEGPVAGAIALARAREAGDPSPELESRIADAFVRATARPRTATRTWAFDFLAEVMEKQGDQPPEYLRRNAERLFAELHGYRLRMQAMADAALDAPDLETLRQRLEAAGFAEVTVEAVRDDDGRDFAWRLVAVRRGA